MSVHLQRSPSDTSEPVAKRPRMLAKACETCKQKKSRCDSGRPQCDTCRRKGVACIYKEKGQPGLRPGYGKAIETRLAVLESNVDSMTQCMREVLEHVRGGSLAAATPAMVNGNPVSCPEVRLDQVGASIVSPAHSDTTVNDSQSLVVSSVGDVPFVERIAQPELEPDQYRASTTGAIEQLQVTPPIPDLRIADDTLPPVEILQELVEIFFDLVYPWAPLFFKPTFITTMFSPDKRVLLHGIVVTSFRFWQKPRPPPTIRDAYIQTSREQILLRTINVCTVTSTQALTLLALDALGNGQGPRTWNVMSMLVCAARHLCLSHQASPSAVAETDKPLVRNEDPDDDDPTDLSSIEAEERRRLYWVIYSIDRLSSVSHGQSGGTDTKSIRLPYPVHDDDWAHGPVVAPEWFQPIAALGQGQQIAPQHHKHRLNLWHQYIDLLALVDRSNQLLLRPVNFSIPAHCQEWQSNFRRLDTTLTTWFDQLPPEAREPPSRFDPMWVMVHATFHLINIRMYTVAAFPSNTSPYLPPSASARARCRQAVRDAASLASSLQERDLAQLGPMFAFVVWVAARSLIILWTTGYEKTYGSTTPSDLDPLLGCLRILERQWPCAGRYADLIQLILDTKNNPGGPTGLEVFNDTRRTAYGLQVRLGTLAGERLPEFDFFGHADFGSR
ncbi:Fungal specific transcription factor domain-containing protein isoform 2 [Mycena sanguinolenta]|uniref:Fungal specific transcription factor domain-containing protein isoform 2 n=1 Tax=Mycena sanguinolenta TaxID=230812 RepID=A0A8H6YE79_9AGAR|nr:Fungal specific transcription factor domain-containing protein isoform 2 [Mycena sanguinolenta]